MRPHTIDTCCELRSRARCSLAHVTAMYDVVWIGRVTRCELADLGRESDERALPLRGADSVTDGARALCEHVSLGDGTSQV